MLLAEQVARHLHAREVVVFDPASTAASAFLDRLPAEPDRAVAFRRTAGPARTDTLPRDTAGLQAIVRGPAHSRDGEEFAMQIYGELENLTSVLLPGDGWLVACWAQQSGPVYVGDDPAGRPEYSLNFVVEVSSPTVHRTA
jgi:hypothetical protein